jgi:predicted 3-demethylubiquinone-9 3-methyltransferase (glyoxalase superfamily)
MVAVNEHCTSFAQHNRHHFANGAIQNCTLLTQSKWTQIGKVNTNEFSLTSSDFIAGSRGVYFTNSFAIYVICVH